MSRFPVSKSRPLFAMRVAFACVCSLLLLPASTFAKSSGSAECKASGPPGQSEAGGPSELMTPLEYDGEHWLVGLDRAKMPKHIRMWSSSGRSMELPAAPTSFSPKAWFGRGRAVYGLGTSRSMADGKTNIVVVRWSMDGRRPGVLRLWSPSGKAEGLTGAVYDETLIVGWSDAGDGKARWMVGSANLELQKVGDEVQMGTSSSPIAGHVMNDGKGFVSLWIADGTARVARFGIKGPDASKTEELKGAGSLQPTAVAQCGSNLFALTGSKDDEARLLLLKADGPKELTKFSTVLNVSEMPLRCTGDAAVVGHRVWNDKVGSVVFWISAVDAAGGVRARRLKDLKGDKDDIQMPTLIGSGPGLSAWWAQKNGGNTEVYTRPVGCSTN